MNQKMKLREYRPDDCEKIAELLYNTVHSVNSVDYNEAQLDAWVPKDMNLIQLNDRLSNTYCVVAEQDGVIVGFGNTGGIGYFDFLYVHKDYQRMGVATMIADEIERYIISHQGVKTITADVSITAKPFFEKRGYLVEKMQNVELRGHSFVNFKMQKTI